MRAVSPQREHGRGAAKASFDDAEEAAGVNIEPRMPESNTDASSASLRASVEKLQMEFSQRRLDEKEEAVVRRRPKISQREKRWRYAAKKSRSC